MTKLELLSTHTLRHLRAAANAARNWGLATAITLELSRRRAGSVAKKNGKLV